MSAKRRAAAQLDVWAELVLAIADLDLALARTYVAALTVAIMDSVRVVAAQTVSATKLSMFRVAIDTSNLGSQFMVTVELCAQSSAAVLAPFVMGIQTAVKTYATATDVTAIAIQIANPPSHLVKNQV